jgi:hypothetical protein
MSVFGSNLIPERKLIIPEPTTTAYHPRANYFSLSLLITLFIILSKVICMGEFGMILFRTQCLSIKAGYSSSILKEHFKRFAKRLRLN